MSAERSAPVSDEAADPRPVLAVDIGGTKIAVALVGPDAAVSDRVVVPTPVSGRPEEAWATVTAAAAGPLARAAARGGIRGIGIGSAGPVDPAAGTISPVMITVWRDAPVRAWAAAWAPGVPVVLTGDGICVATGEHWAGAGRGARNMLGCTVSTGVGGGLILGGRPWPGPSSNAGHIGHVITDPDGPSCPCGSRGCLELTASGTALLSRARAAGWIGPGPGASTADLADAARAEDPVATRAFADAGRALAAAFTSVCAVCDLDLIVVGGGVAQAGPLLFDAIDAGMREFAGLPFLRRVAVRRAELGADTGLIGAAAPLHRPDRYAAPENLRPPPASHPLP
ncbi:sugar kinase [Streptomyces sulfonofaciens]|uniref:Sugar kinase n=1 Tax=Streptomyces sulfonofaciens TaxID=68272 RepID=A0A919GMV2_9ACTN|nr:ROK family protein [Streptomyces sulfonofaciens]GHH87472.1 sugar kinase [Streptomyces sulfonofaciens]